MLNSCAYWAAVPGPIDQALLRQAETQRVRVWRLDSTRVELRDPTIDSLRLEGVTTDIRGQVLRSPRDSILRVDGGATANNWLMQFEAGLIGVPVERPDVVETTALGAGALAGIALGVWPSIEAFTAGRTDARFEPHISATEREAHWHGWRRAVGAALAWARSDR